MPLHECPEGLMVACRNCTRDCEIRWFCDCSGYGLGLRKHGLHSWSHSVSGGICKTSVPGLSDWDKPLPMNNIVSGNVLIHTRTPVIGLKLKSEFAPGPQFLRCLPPRHVRRPSCRPANPI